MIDKYPKNKTKIQKTCKVCGEKYLVRLIDFKSKACSLKCRDILLTKKVLIKCEICKKQFPVHRYRKDTARTCSLECNKARQRIMAKTYNQRKKIVKRKCKHCGKEFEVWKCRTKRKGIKGGIYCSNKCKSYGDAKRGADNNLWCGGLTTIAEEVRKSPEMKMWRKLVYERDNHTCQSCGRTGGRLEAHHIDFFALNKKRRTDVGNGLTLCRKCHIELHNIIGRGKKNDSSVQL